MNKVRFIEKERQVGCTSELALLAARAVQSGKKVAFFHQRAVATANFQEKFSSFLFGLGVPNLNCQEAGNGVYTNGGRFKVVYKDRANEEKIDLIILDEVSFVENLEETLTALVPTLSKNGKVVMSSTVGENRTGVDDSHIVQKHLSAKVVVEKFFGSKNVKVVKMS